MKNLNAKIFLEKANGSDMGRWYILPMDEEKLNDLFYNSGLVITDYDIDYDFASFEVTKETIRDFNYVLNRNNSLLLTIFMAFDKDLDTAKDVYADIDNPCFIYLEDIENGTDSEINIQIGERLVDMGLFGDVPKALLDKGYVDFESIGRDYCETSGSHYEASTKTVFMQVSSR